MVPEFLLLAFNVLKSQLPVGMGNKMRGRIRYHFKLMRFLFSIYSVYTQFAPVYWVPVKMLVVILVKGFTGFSS